METLYSAFSDHFPCTVVGSMSSYDEKPGVRIIRSGENVLKLSDELSSTVQASRRYVILHRVQPLKDSSWSPRMNNSKGHSKFFPLLKGSPILSTTLNGAHWWTVLSRRCHFTASSASTLWSLWSVNR
jgi:hypothetical protein